MKLSGHPEIQHLLKRFNGIFMPPEFALGCSQIQVMGW
jgi:hypothetical protein